MRKFFVVAMFIISVLFAAQTPGVSQSTSQAGSTCVIKNELPKKQSKSCLLTIEAKGVGIVPCNGTCTPALAKAMARRAAILDGYKALAEKMYGIKINGRDTVKDMMLQNSSLRAYVFGLIRGAQIIEEDYKDGMYSVVMQVQLDTRAWNAYLKNIDND